METDLQERDPERKETLRVSFLEVGSVYLCEKDPAKPNTLLLLTKEDSGVFVKLSFMNLESSDIFVTHCRPIWNMELSLVCRGG